MANERPALVPWLALIISLVSIVISYRNCNTSTEALGIARSTSKLDLDPDLRIHQYLGNNRANYLAFFNNGPVPATNVTVQLFHLGYDPKKREVSIGHSQQPANAYFSSIQPKNTGLMPIDRKHLVDRVAIGYADAPSMSEPFYDDILEVRVRFYREADNKVYGGRKFCYRTPEKEWANDNQSSFPRDILEAARRLPTREFPPFFALDPLNE